MEHSSIKREVLDDIYFGPVVGIEDPENLHRIQVRIRGVFDEPIATEDIYWALPLMNSAPPQMGDEVAVLFLGGDIEKPVYFPNTILDKAVVDKFLGVYSGIVDKKKAAKKTGVTAGTASFDEPETESVAAISASKKATLLGEVLHESGGVAGEEIESIYHPSGTFIEIQKDGTVIIHGVKDLFHIIEGDLNGLVEGAMIYKVGGAVTLKVGTLELAGTVAPNAGPFCAIPNCLFTGAPHTGKTVVSP